MGAFVCITICPAAHTPAPVGGAPVMVRTGKVAEACDRSVIPLKVFVPLKVLFPLFCA
jgi:hypothetical protein